MPAVDSCFPPANTPAAITRILTREGIMEQLALFAVLGLGPGALIAGIALSLV
jgi:hypothetical protein